MRYKLINKTIEDLELKTEIRCATLLDEFDNVIKTYQFPITNNPEENVQIFSVFLDVLFAVCKKNNEVNISIDFAEQLFNNIRSLYDKIGVEFIEK